MESPHGVLSPEQSNLMYVSRGGWNFQWSTGKDGQLPTWIGALPEFQLSTFIFKKTFVDAQALFVAQAPFERHARIHGGGFKKVSLVISLQSLVYIVWFLLFVLLNITCFMVLLCRLLFSSSRLHWIFFLVPHSATNGKLVVWLCACGLDVFWIHKGSLCQRDCYHSLEFSYTFL